ncbi:hypothetical protein MKW94_017792 [Papaver nudicaule]|uniref:RRM domain-containing protein n=1 Tax=Papaver nudicaule TaxID=74823 RepID=A0AA41VXJ5_PAPNU|nr:hypothetical protein [Papaver nudicaule]
MVVTSKSVLAKSLPVSMDKSELIEFFKQAGEVVDARYQNACKTKCRIEYATEEAANKALLELHGQRKIRVYPVGRATGRTKILIAKNLNPYIKKSQVIDFFKQAGVISDVRFSFDENGGFRGHCHVEFATEEGAKKAAELNGEYLLDRPVVLGYARETICVRGFDTDLGYDKIRSSLEELFSTYCGQILWMHIPTFPDGTCVPRGMAFIEFFDVRDYPKGLAMNGHRLGDSTLKVEDACPPEFHLRPTGPRKRICGKPVGPYVGSFYRHRYFRDRGYGGAGIGKQGSIYHFPPGKKIKFDHDSPV